MLATPFRLLLMCDFRIRQNGRKQKKTKSMGRIKFCFPCVTNLLHNFGSPNAVLRHYILNGHFVLYNYWVTMK
jgi:hypothetical protein